MALTEVPIELSSTPGIVDNSTATAITIDASQNVTLSANLTVNGDLITFGDANTDSIDFVADIGSNLTPSGTNTYDLGTTLKKWRDAYISGTADIATLSSASSTIGTLTVSTTATIPYDNVTSGLTAINVQSALDELSVLAGGGNVGSQANFDVYEFTATAAQATFDLNATYSETYVPGYIQVYLNGLLLSETDYVASNGSVVVLNDPAELSDILAIVVLDSFNTATQLRVLSIDASASDDAVSVDSSDNVTLLAELRGPATFVIDPAAIGDNTGTVQIKGNLQVDGTQTTINSTTLDVTDLNITVASGAADAAAANGAGITVDGAAANITYTSVTDSWDFNKEIIGSSNIVTSGFNRFVANSTSAGDYVRVYGADGTGKWDIYGNGANLRIGDNESAGIVQIDTGMYVSGPVGIGTSSPDRLIDLRTAPAEDWQLRLGANNTDLDTYDIGRDAGDGLLHFYGNQTGYTGYVFDGINGERMRIDASGNVGIGQAPAALFHVVETDGGAPDAIIRIQSDDTANSKSLIQFLGRNVSNVATYATVHTDAVAAGTNAPIVFSQGASEANERMRIDENGNAGIGTSSPFFTAAGRTSLSVNGTSSSILAFGKGGSSENYILADAGGLTIANTSATLPTTFFNNASNSMTISAAGNVGIGVVPSADSFFKSLEIGNTGSGITGRGAADTHFMSGLIWDGNSTQEYTVSSVAVGKYQITNGIHSWSTAPAGTAGDAATPQTNMILDASGNVGIGTSSPNSYAGQTALTINSPAVARLDLDINDAYQGYLLAEAGYIGLYAQSGNYISMGVGGVGEAMRIDSSGTTTFTKSGGGNIRIAETASRYVEIFGYAEGTANGSTMAFHTIESGTSTSTERMRITNTGYTKMSPTGTYVGAASSYHEMYQNYTGITSYIYNGSATGDGLLINTNNENTSNFFLAGYSDSALRYNFYIYSNGDQLNRNNSYGGFSDQKLKQDIEDASSQWEDVKAMQFRKYRWKQDVAADADAPYQLGVIAQELEAAGMSGLVEETADKEFYDEVCLDSDGNPVVDEDGNNVTEQKERLTGESTKSVKYSILTMKALVALQEAMTRIESLEARIAALES